MIDHFGSQVLKLDSQGRIKIPSSQVVPLRDGGKLIMSLDFQSPCIFIMSRVLWDDKLTHIANLPNNYIEIRNIKRRIIGNARNCEIDSADRLAIPKLMRDLIGLDDSCVLVGQGNKCEIWSENKWLEISQKDIDLSHIPQEVFKENDALNF